MSIIEIVGHLDCEYSGPQRAAMHTSNPQRQLGGLVSGTLVLCETGSQINLVLATYVWSRLARRAPTLHRIRCFLGHLLPIHSFIRIGSISRDIRDNDPTNDT